MIAFKKSVLKRFPEAFCAKFGTGYGVWPHKVTGSMTGLVVLATGRTKREAWQQADKNL